LASGRPGHRHPHIAGTAGGLREWLDATAAVRESGGRSSLEARYTPTSCMDLAGPVRKQTSDLCRPRLVWRTECHVMRGYSQPGALLPRRTERRLGERSPRPSRSLSVMRFIGVVRGRLRTSALFSDLLEVAGRDLSIFPAAAGRLRHADLTRHMRRNRMSRRRGVHKASTEGLVLGVAVG
jgi:hypothetical protein